MNNSRRYHGLGHGHGSDGQKHGPRSPQWKFLQAVRTAYPGSTGKYDLLMASLRRYQNGYGTIRSLMEEVGSLLMDQSNLVEGFNAFLPEGYSVQVLSGRFGPVVKTVWRNKNNVIVVRVRGFD